MAMDIPTLRDRLTAALRSGAAPDQLVDLQHGGLRRNFLPFDVDLSDGAFSSNLGGLLDPRFFRDIVDVFEDRMLN